MVLSFLPTALDDGRILVAGLALGLAGAALLAVVALGGSSGGPSETVTVDVVSRFNSSAYEDRSDWRSKQADLPPGHPATNGTVIVSIPEGTGTAGTGTEPQAAGVGPDGLWLIPVPLVQATSEASDGGGTVPADPGQYRFDLGADGNVTLEIPRGVQASFWVWGDAPDPDDDCRAEYRGDAQRAWTRPRIDHKGTSYPIERNFTVVTPFVVECEPRKAD